MGSRVSLAPDAGFPAAHTLRWFLFAAGLAAAWACRSRIRRSLTSVDGGAWFTTFLYGGFFVLFAWYHQVSSSERFIGVLNPIVFVLLGGALVGGWDELRPRFESVLGERSEFWTKAFLGCWLLVTGMTVWIKASTWGLARPFATDRPLACYAEVYRKVDGAERLLYGPSGDLPTYQFETRPKTFEIPEGSAPESLGAWLDERADLAVVDGEMAEKPFLSAHFESLEDRRVRLKSDIPGWTVEYADAHHEPPHVLVLRRLD
jgi:hypothetical protein